VIKVDDGDLNNDALCLVIAYLLSATCGERWDARDKDASVVERFSKVVASPDPYFAHFESVIMVGLRLVSFVEALLFAPTSFSQLHSVIERAQQSRSASTQPIYMMAFVVRWKK
jgi:hypothetical protein